MRCLLWLLVVVVPFVEGKEVALTESSGWQLENVEVQETTYLDNKCLRVRAIKQPRERGREHLAILSGVEFSNGTIELQLAGKPLAGAGRMARGFIGVAFRVQEDAPENYEAFYLRPTNGRAEDQVRRNHSVQYISHPAHPWMKLRKESPGKYESYADLVPGEWTKVKVVVKDTDARLFVNGADQPCLIVKDLKHGESKGALALWIEPSTDAYFRDLKVSVDQLTPSELVGTWSYTGGIKDGERLGAGHFEGQSVVFTKDQLVLHSKTADGDAKFVMAYRLDPDSSPMGMSMEITESPFGAGSKTKGIIGLVDGKLTLCYSPTGGEAPKDFKADSGTGFYMFQLERQ